MRKNSRSKDAGGAPRDHRGQSISVAALLIFVMLLSTGSGYYAGASLLAQQAPNAAITTTVYTTTTSWTTSTIWSTVTETVEGILTTIEYTTSVSTVTVTSSSSTLFTLTVSVYDSRGNQIYLAFVYLDGVLTGTTNYSGMLVIEGVTYGSHTLAVTKSGFRTVSQVIDVTADMAITITLSPIAQR